MKKVTLSVIKADVGSIGGHTKPSERMMAIVRARAKEATEKGMLIDALAELDKEFSLRSANTQKKTAEMESL